MESLNFAVISSKIPFIIHNVKVYFFAVENYEGRIE